MTISRSPFGCLSVSGFASLISILAFFALALGSAWAQELPSLSGRVVDGAGILSNEVESALTATLAGHEQASSDQVVVATIDTTDGESIESYANRLFRHWGLGQAEENNGVLLLVAVDDRKMRIEVGYGLEGTLTDVLAKLIIDNTIVRHFRDGDFEGGIRAGADDIIAVLSGNAAELQARAERNADRWDNSLIGRFVFLALFATIFVGTFGFAVLARIFGRKIAPGRYRWLGMDITYGGSSSSSGSSGWSGGSSGGFSGGGGSSGGGGASGGW